MINKFVIIFSFLILSIYFISCNENESNNKVINKDSTISQKKVETSDTLTVIGVGDIMMGSTHPAPLLPPNDGKNLFDDVKEKLENADLTFGNLEGPFLDKGGIPKTCGGATSGCIAFRMPERYCSYLKNAGFDLVNLANNHAGDMGLPGRETTYKVLNDNKILYAGTLDFPESIIERNNLKIGFIGFAPNVGTVSILQLDEASKKVKELKSRTDIVIVTFHGGGEGTGAQNVKRVSEMYLNENRGNVYKFAHSVIDAGADLVIGHGPHVTRAVELYNNKFIAYSLGNFCTYGKFSLYGALGIAPILKVYIDKNGNFLKAQITSIKQIKNGIPVIDENHSAFKNIQRLTNEDFYDTPLRFDISNTTIYPQ